MSLAIRKDTDAYKATQVGKIAGFGVATAHLIKNKEDIFVNTLKASVEQYGSKKNGIIGVSIAAGFALLAGTGIGAAIGKFIGTISDNIKFKKALKNVEHTPLKMDLTSFAFDDMNKKTI